MKRTPDNLLHFPTPGGAQTPPSPLGGMEEFLGELSATLGLCREGLAALPDSGDTRRLEKKIDRLTHLKKRIRHLSKEIALWTP